MFITSNPGSINPNNMGRVCPDALTGAVVLMVSKLVTGPPLGVTLDGLNEQLAPVGRPLQLKLTDWLNPVAGVSVIVVVPLPPGEPMDTVAGLGAILKGVVTVSVTVAVCVMPWPVPVTVIV
jgi:hypothetical protein